MGWLDEFRKRNETATGRIVERPLLAWVGHAVVFTTFAVLLQLLRSSSVDWTRAVLLGTLVAAAVVAGTIFGSWARSRRP
ncbi:MAG TPA: hypothetical protein VHN37_05665 [Actinomycetota bacterium]|nr:hypothetical protein [Actinomycetota bacterium]